MHVALDTKPHQSLKGFQEKFCKAHTAGASTFGAFSEKSNINLLSPNAFYTVL